MTGKGGEGYLHLLRNSGRAASPLRPRAHGHHCPPAPCLSPPRSLLPRAASLPRPALTSEPLGVVLGGAERRLRPKASVHDSVAGLEIRGRGRVQAALCRGGWPGSGEAQGPASWPRLSRPWPLPQPSTQKHRAGGVQIGRGPPGGALTCPGAHLRRRPRWTAWCRRGSEPGRSAPRPPAAATLSAGRASRPLEPLGSWGVWLHSPLPVPLPPAPLSWTPTLWAFSLLRSHGSVPTQ